MLSQTRLLCIELVMWLNRLILIHQCVKGVIKESLYIRFTKRSANLVEVEFELKRFAEEGLNYPGLAGTISLRRNPESKEWRMGGLSGNVYEADFKYPSFVFEGTYEQRKGIAVSVYYFNDRTRLAGKFVV